MDTALTCRSRLVAALSSVVLSSGCSALAQRHLDGIGYPYDATREYPRLIECVEAMGPLGLIFVPYMVIDFPFTLLAETLLLPLDSAFRSTEQKKTVTCK